MHGSLFTQVRLATGLDTALVIGPNDWLKTHVNCFLVVDTV